MNINIHFWGITSYMVGLHALVREIAIFICSCAPAWEASLPRVPTEQGVIKWNTCLQLSVRHILSPMFIPNAKAILISTVNRYASNHSSCARYVGGPWEGIVYDSSKTFIILLGIHGDRIASGSVSSARCYANFLFFRLIGNGRYTCLMMRRYSADLVN